MQVRYRYLENSFNHSKILNKKIKNFLKKGQFLSDQYRFKFEKKISNIFKNNCVSVSSGTNALYLILKLLNLKKNDNILVPCLSWLSTFTAVKSAGAIPLGIDIDDYLQMNLKNIEKQINKNTKAIIFVHFTGLVTDLTSLKKLCKKKKIFLIEDAAQAFGGLINGKFAGNFGDFASFSVNPMKVFSSVGQLGLILYKNKKYKKRIESLLYAGTKNKELCVESELNHKADNIQMLFAEHKLNSIKSIIKKRINIAKMYDNHLTSEIKKPLFKEDGSHIYYDYTIQSKQRNKLKIFLKKKNIETKIRHPFLINDHVPFQKNNEIYKFKNGKKILKNILSLPIDESLSLKQIKYVIKITNSFFKQKSKI